MEEKRFNWQNQSQVLDYLRRLDNNDLLNVCLSNKQANNWCKDKNNDFFGEKDFFIWIHRTSGNSRISGIQTFLNTKVKEELGEIFSCHF
jgi:hypothetical protein